MRRQRRCPHGLSMAICLVVLWLAQPGVGMMITEVMYHPAGQSATTEDEKLEFLELYNNREVSGRPYGMGIYERRRLYLQPTRSWALSSTWSWPAIRTRLKAAYGVAKRGRPYTGKLDNAGERIELSNANGGIVISFRYGYRQPVAAAPDGAGHHWSSPARRRPRRGRFLVGQRLYRRQSRHRRPEPDLDDGSSTTVTLVDIGSPGGTSKATRNPPPAPATTDRCLDPGELRRQSSHHLLARRPRRIWLQQRCR